MYLREYGSQPIEQSTYFKLKEVMRGKKEGSLMNGLRMRCQEK